MNLLMLEDDGWMMEDNPQKRPKSISKIVSCDCLPHFDLYVEDCLPHFDLRSKNAYSQENLQKSLGKGVAPVRVAFRNHVEKLQKLP